MLGGRRRAAVIAAPLTLMACAVAVAATNEPPTAERLEARIVFERVTGKERECPAREGGNFYEQIATVTGSATGDPRLTGVVSMSIRANTNDAGDGYQVGRLRVSDPTTGALKAVGRFWHADTAEISQGVLVGELRTAARSAGTRMRFFINQRFTFLANPDAPSTVTAQLGGEAADARLPATLTSGRCTGPYTRFEADLTPPPPQGSAGESGLGAMGGGTGWWRAR